MENNNITFNDAVMTCLHKYADFSGRACRSEYWYFVVFNMVVQAGLNALGRLVFGADSNLAPVLASIYALAVLSPLSLLHGGDFTMSVSPAPIGSSCCCPLWAGSSFSFSSAKTVTPVRTSTA